MQPDSTAVASVVPSPTTGPSLSNSLSAEEKWTYLTRLLFFSKDERPSESTICFLVRAFDNGRSLLSYTDPGIARIANCTTRHAQRIRAWCIEHNALSMFDLDDIRTSMSVCMSNLLDTSKKEEKEINIHEDIHVQEVLGLPPESEAEEPVHSLETLLEELPEEERATLDREKLAVENLPADFMTHGTEDGRRVPWKDRALRMWAWVHDHGARNVLYALHHVEKKPKKNPSGFIMGGISEGTVRAPDGWEHPAFKDPEYFERQRITKTADYKNEVDEVEDLFVPSEKDYLVLELEDLEQRLEPDISKRASLRVERGGSDSLSQCCDEELNQYRTEVLKRLAVTIDERPNEVHDTPPELSEVYSWLRMRPQTQDDWWEVIVDTAMTYGADGSVIFWTTDERSKTEVERKYGELIREGLHKHQDSLWQSWRRWEAWTHERPAPRRKLRFEALVQ